MQGNGNAFTLLASNSGVLSGNTTSFTWPGLSPGSSYEWYVTVSNSTGTAVGPLWSFTTSGSSPVTLSPSSLTFPGQPVNTTSGSQSVTLTNTGSAALSISNIAASAQFAQTNSCPISPSTLPVNGTCSINVTFTPTATGTQSGSITITDNASGSPQVSQPDRQRHVGRRTGREPFAQQLNVWQLRHHGGAGREYHRNWKHHASGDVRQQCYAKQFNRSRRQLLCGKHVCFSCHHGHPRKHLVPRYCQQSWNGWHAFSGQYLLCGCPLDRN